ncbi:hypothetical protein AVL50_19910 [Flammeovirga sp. SJP92]|nr:hypothetical protein AVL50_19910 [Flammeovirga sp. SJP92]
MNRRITTLIFLSLLPCFGWAQDDTFSSLLKNESASLRYEIIGNQLVHRNTGYLNFLSCYSVYPDQDIDLTYSQTGVYICGFSQHEKIYTIKLLKK